MEKMDKSIEARGVEAHAAECAACAALLAMRRDCRRMDEEVEVPDAFSFGWREKIREEKAIEKVRRKGLLFHTLQKRHT